MITKELNKYKNIEIPLTICKLPIYIENNKDKIDYSTYEKITGLLEAEQ